MKHKFAIEYEGINGKREFANTDELIVNGESIENVVVIPNNATNGDMIKAMFPNAEIKIHKQWDEQSIVTVRIDDVRVVVYSLDWWNAPYKAESEPRESEE